MRAPTLSPKIVDSLEALLAEIPAAAFLGTNKEVGVKFLDDFVKAYRSPEAVARRAKAAALTRRQRKSRA